MKTNNSQPSSDVVARSINYESIIDADEYSILGTCSRELSDACKVIYEWLVRTPHVYPFNEKSVLKKDIRGFLRYQEALIDCVYGVAQIVFQEREFGDSANLKLSPVIKEIVDSTKAWFLAMEVSDEEMVDYWAQADLNVYKTMLGPERGKFEAALNQLSLLQHKRLMDSGFREKVDSFKKNSTKRFKQTMRVCSQAWSRHRSVLVIRLDWGYRYQVPDVRGRFASEQDYIQRFKKVSGYRIKMLKELRKIYGDDLVFFFWKIECASVRGLHIHWFIGLNGAKHQDRINVPRAIAERWDEVLGLDNAYTRNINAHQKHEQAILRVIDYDDPLLWRIVGGYADYLTKVDYLVRHRTPQGMHSFGGTNYKNTMKKKKGPQRSKKMPKLDLSAVRRSLNDLTSEMGSKGAQ